MKIIGKTDQGYIATLSGDEIAVIAGFTSKYEWDRAGTLPHDLCGISINVTALGRWPHTVREREKTARIGAMTLRDLAALIESNLPSVLIPEPGNSGSDGQ